MITYTIGDATAPTGDGKKYIIHVCNDIGRWGRGFVLALSAKWKDPEHWYREWYKNRKFAATVGADFALGNVQYIPVADDITVVNMIGQHDVAPDAQGNPPVRYDAIRACLKKLNAVIEGAKTRAKLSGNPADWVTEFSVHAPKFGAGLAGGNWETIEAIINEELPNIPVTVYTLE